MLLVIIPLIIWALLKTSPSNNDPETGIALENVENFLYHLNAQLNVQ